MNRSKFLRTFQFNDYSLFNQKIDALAINAEIFELNRYWNLLLRSNST